MQVNNKPFVFPVHHQSYTGEQKCVRRSFNLLVARSQTLQSRVWKPYGSIPVYSVKHARRNKSGNRKENRSTKRSQILRDVMEDAGGMWLYTGNMSILEEEDDIKLQVTISTRRRIRGHRGKEASEDPARSEFHFRKLKADTYYLEQNLTNCIIDRTKKRMPRLLAKHCHGHRTNKMVRMTLLYIRKAKGSVSKYLLLSKDDLSAYTWLALRGSADCGVGVDSLSRWMVAFTVCIGLFQIEHSTSIHR